MIYFLYKKIHNDTGLKYLGKTIQNPYVYRGSGKYWTRHLKIHGNNVTTEVIGAFSDREDMEKASEYFSDLWNIVESKEWANLIPETDIGGGAVKGTKRPDLAARNRLGLSEETKKKISRLGAKQSEETRNKIRETLMKNPKRGRPRKVAA